MSLETQHSIRPRTKVDVICWAWLVAFGTALTWWNLQSGYPVRAKAIGLVMVIGASIYVIDVVTTMYDRGNEV